MIAFRIKNYKDLENILEENSALVDVKILRELYEKAVEQPYSFLYINLAATSIDEMFYKSFEARLIPRWKEKPITTAISLIHEAFHLLF